VPATSGNLGSGFDALGLALALRNRVSAVPAARLAVTVLGEGEGELPAGAGNLVADAYHAAFALRGQRPVPLAITIRAAIPVARGLGSSAAAIAAGTVLAAPRLDPPLELDEAIDLGTRLEGHPDNILAALVGGVTVGAAGPEGVSWMRITGGERLRVLALVPATRLATAVARRVLPRRVSLPAAVFKIGRAALLAAALAKGDPRPVATGLGDRLHQPYRARLVPGLDEVIALAPQLGALGAYLSGAGPTIALLFGADEAPVARAARALARRFPERRVLALRVSSRGAWPGVIS
jgi:homoserine kinase